MENNKKVSALFLGICFVLAGCVGTDVTDDTGSDMTMPARIELTPSDSAILVDSTVQYDAAYFDTLGNQVDTVSFEWIVEDDEIASISPGGVATGLSMGQTMIQAATHGIISESALLTVVSDPTILASIEIDPASVTIDVGDTVQFSAKAINLLGDEVPGVSFDWQILDPIVARVEEDGLAIAMSSGMTGIVAKANSIESSPAQITVRRLGRSGSFTPSTGSTYTVRGTATLRRFSDGSLTLSFTSNFFVDEGPGLHVYLSHNRSVTGTSRDLGELQRTVGAQSYDVPDDIGLETFDYVLIHCVPFNVTFGYALLD